MKPFIFRLESIYRYRMYLEKKAQGGLAEARNRQRHMEKAVNRLVSERTDLAKRCSDAAISGMDVPLYRMYGSFLERLSMELEDAHGELMKVKEKVKTREEALLRESINRKLLDGLKDLMRRRYTANLEREGQKVLDELVVLRRGGEL